MLKLAVDLRPLLEPFESGVTQYTRALVQKFLRRSDLQLDLFYQARERCEAIHSAFPQARHIPVSNSFFHLRSLFRFPPLPVGYFPQQPDLVWLPDRRPFYRSNLPLVMTIHDLVPERCRSSLSLKSRLWHRIFSLKRLLTLCHGLLVPSFTTAGALKTKLPLEVSYEGVSLAKAQVPSWFKKPRKAFFVVISPLDPRKRLSWVFTVAERFPKVEFLILGIKASDKRFTHLPLPRRRNVHCLGPVTEAEKAWFLRHACALLALSAYEGFDLPVLEAVQAHCPVILSSISVHHELYKEACFVRSVEELKGAVYKAQQKKIPVPKPRGEYTWEKAAERSLLLFLRVLRDKNR